MSSRSLLTPTGSLDPPITPKYSKALRRGTLTRPRTQEHPALTGAAAPANKARNKLLRVLFIYLFTLSSTDLLPGEEA